MSETTTVETDSTNKLTCNSKIFDELNNYATSEPSIKPEVVEANVLYNNGKFYYSSGESVGALVSYSCAAVLLNTILRKLPENQVQLKLSVNTIMNSLLQVVQSLQHKVGSSKSSDKDDTEKDWGKICTKIKPLVFKKGGSDCLFYNDVAGLQKEKKIIDSSLVYPLIYPNLYPKTSKGILIYGPPGTGKTYLVKAAVNELQKKDDSVGVLFFAPSPGDLKGKYVGETEKRIEEAFRCASDAACTYQSDCAGKKKYISIIFMDEMDAIAPDRDKDTTGLAVNSVNTLLQMMDGIKSFPNVAVVAATNYPWNLDAAILRRFDTQLLINIPNQYDLKELFNIEMTKFIDLETDKSNFSYCDSKGKKNDDSSDLSCELECESKPIIEKHRNYPYSEYEIDYFLNNKVGGLVDGIIFQLENDKFSNSDLNRLIKAAATNAGELAVNQSLFYSPKLLGDFEHDKYVSSLTGLRISHEIQTPGAAKGKKVVNLVKIAQLSIDILQAFVSNQLPKNVIQLNPPDFVRIKYNGYYYYNSKCLLYKNADSIVQHYSIKDIYIKGHPATEGFSFDDWRKNVTGADNYFTNILGTSQAELANEDTIIKKGDIDMIVAFDFTFKQNKNYSNKQTLLPVYRDLINCIFQPIYNKFGEIKKNIEMSEKIGKDVRGPTGEIDTGISQEYSQGIKEPPKENQQTPEENRREDEDEKLKLINDESVRKINQRREVERKNKEVKAEVKNKKDAVLNELKTTTGVVQGGGAKLNFTDVELQNIKDGVFFNEESGVVRLSDSAIKIISGPGFINDWYINLNNKFSSINEHNLDFYNFLLLNKVLTEFKSEFIPPIDSELIAGSLFSLQNIDDLLNNAFSEYNDLIQAELSLKNELKDDVCKGAITIKDNFKDMLNDALSNSQCNQNEVTEKESDYEALKIDKAEKYAKYIKLQTIKDELNREPEKGTIRETINVYLSMINSEGKINEATSKIDDLEFKSYSLINGETVSIYYYKLNKDDNYGTFRVNVAQYKKFVTNFHIYNNIVLCPSEFDAKFIDISEDLFEVIFKDVFSDIKITTTDVEELKKIWTPNSLETRLTQLYINDTIRMHNLKLELLDTKSKETIKNITWDKEIIDTYLYGYLLTLLSVEPIVVNLSNLSIQLINDNYNLANNNRGKFLGKSDPIMPSNENNILDEKNLAELVNSPFNEVKTKVEDTKRTLEQQKSANKVANDAILRGEEEAQKQGLAVAETVETKKAEEELGRKRGLFVSFLNIAEKFLDQMNGTGSAKDEDMDGGGKAKTLKNRRQHSHLSSSFRKHKKHSESKARSFKSKKIVHKMRTQTLRNRTKYIGGAKMSEDLEKFIEWCVKNEQKIDSSALAAGELGPIAGKTVFVKTVFRYEELVKQRKHGVVSDIWNSADFGWGDWFTGKKKTPKQKANAILQEIKSKNQLLPLIFNNIQSIGTLTNNADNKITDDALLFKEAKNLKLKWHPIQLDDRFWNDNFGQLASTLLGMRSKKGGTLWNNVTGVLATIIAGAMAGGPYGALAAVAVITVANTINWLTQNPTVKDEDVILFMVSQALFTILTDIRYIECQNFTEPGGANVAILFEIAERAKQISEVWSNSQSGATTPSPFPAQTSASGSNEDAVIVELYTAAAKTVLNKDIKNKLVNLNIPMQSFYYAMNIVKSTYNKETGPLLTQYYENRDLFMENYKKREQKQSK